MIENKRPIHSVASEILAQKVVYQGIENVQPPHPLWRMVVHMAARYYAAPLIIEGQENLHRAQEMSEEYHGGIIFAGTHFSNADGPMLRIALIESGLKEPDPAVYVLGLRLLQRRETNFLSRSVPYIPVWPPTEKAIDETRKIQTDMNVRAIRAARRINQAGIPYVIFPQGGRDAFVIQRVPSEESSGFLTISKDAVIVPTGIVADRVLPKGKVRPVRGEVLISFGNPFAASELIREFRRDRQGIADYVMYEAAQQIPYEKRGIYRGRL